MTAVQARADRSTVQSKRLNVSATTFITVPVAHVPTGVTTADWERLSRINDEIIDRVHYDYARSRSPMQDGVQSPDVTLKRGLGVCMDYSALFEQMARQAGYTVRSVHSESIDHAWNQVLLGGLWRIVDVTWNGGGSFRNGRIVPDRIRRDPDYRRRYFLITIDHEIRLARLGLLQNSHQCGDAKPINYEKTLEARDLISRIGHLVDQRNALVRRSPQPHDEIWALDHRIDPLYERYRHLAAMYPLGVSYQLI